MPTDSPPPGSSTRAYLLATILLVALLGLSLIIYIASTGRQENDNVNRTTNGTDVNRAATTVPPVAPEPIDIRVRAGKIVSLSQRNLRFEAAVYNDSKGQYEKKTLTAEITDATTFLEVDRTALPVPPVPGQPAPKPPTTALSFNDLAVGNNVEVYAEKNIRTQTSFAASTVYRVLTKQ